MPPELILLGITLFLIVTVAVPAIRRGVFLPRELSIETVADEALTGRQRVFFQALDAALAPLGYAPLLNFQVPNLQGANLTRVYRSDYDAAVLGAGSIKSESATGAGAPGGQNYLEWVTKYEDGTTLTTRNVALSDIFDRMPHQVRQDFPSLGDPARLKARHDQRAGSLLERQPRFLHGRDVLAEFAEHHRRWCAFQETRGLLRFDAGTGVYRATAKAAGRGVANFLNPLADNFTLARFVLGVVLGAGLPLLGALAAESTGLPSSLAAATGLGEPICRLAVLGSAFTAGGAAVGWLFTSKSFVWALVLGYTPLRLLAPEAGFELLLAAWMGYVAHRVSDWRSTRELLV